MAQYKTHQLAQSMLPICNELETNSLTLLDLLNGIECYSRCSRMAREQLTGIQKRGNQATVNAQPSGRR